MSNFVESEILQGENAYSCEKCEMRKVSCMKRACLKQLPNALVIVLKRFELNYDTMTHIKLNGSFKFPKELNLREYTVEYIEKLAVLKEIEEKNMTLDQLDDTKRQILETEYPDDYYQYELKGIVIHSGEANAGHYFSFIKDRDEFDTEKWYEFNDSVVLPFDIDELNDKAFGGETEIYFTTEDGIEEHAKTENSSNAYMLIYERSQMYLWETINEKEELVKVDEFGKLTEKVQAKPLESQEEVKIIPEDEQESDIESYMKNRDKLPQKIVMDRKDSMHYEVHIPKQFRDMIQSINMKEWQLKYIFCSEMIDSICTYLMNMEIIKFESYEV